MWRGKGRRWLTLSGRVRVTRRLKKGDKDEEDELVVPDISRLDNDRFALPVELWYHVLCFASLDVLPTASCVCQTWRIIILKDILPPSARMYGKVCIITGCTSGIGKEAALAFAGMGAHVVMACRNVEKAEQVRKELLQVSEDIRGIRNRKKAKMKKPRKRRKILRRRRANIHGPMTCTQPSLEVIPLDLAHLDSIHEFARIFLERHQRLDVLVLNAAVVTPKKILTEGMEMMFCVNHLGHFLLTNLLLERIKETAALPFTPSPYVSSVQTINGPTKPTRNGAKIISIGCDLGMNNDDDLAVLVHGFELSELVNPPQDFDCSAEGLMTLLITYSVSKYCNVLFAHELNRRLKDEDQLDVQVHILFPCPNATALWDGIRKECGFMLASLFRLVSLFGRKAWAAIEMLVQTAATYNTGDTELMLWEPRAKTFEPPLIEEEKATKLWELCEKLTKLKEWRAKEEEEEERRRKVEKKQKKIKSKQRREEVLFRSQQRKEQGVVRDGDIATRIFEQLLRDAVDGLGDDTEDEDGENEREKEKERETERESGKGKEKEEKEKEKEKGAD